MTFQSHLDGSKHRLTPERSVEIQHQLDATITMVLDECTPFPATEEQAASSMALSMRWAARSKEAFVPAGPATRLFGIVQGSVYPAIARETSARALTEIGFDGYAVGGLAIGEGQATTFTVLDATVPFLPADRPRYLMGVGTPDDIIGAVQRGIDMFDCVIPTRAGRTARAYTSQGVFNLRNARFADDAPAAGPGLRLPGLHAPRTRLSAPPVPRGRNARPHAADLAQHHLLPGPDARPARGDRRAAAGGTCRRACAPAGPRETRHDRPPTTPA